MATRETFEQWCDRHEIERLTPDDGEYAAEYAAYVEVVIGWVCPSCGEETDYLSENNLCHACLISERR